MIYYIPPQGMGAPAKAVAQISVSLQQAHPGYHTFEDFEDGKFTNREIFDNPQLVGYWEDGKLLWYAIRPPSYPPSQGYYPLPYSETFTPPTSLKGTVYERPSWIIKEGSPSISNGVLIAPAPTLIYTKSTKVVGYWEMKIRKETVQTSTPSNIGEYGFIVKDFYNYYSLKMDSYYTGNYDGLRVIVAGNVNWLIQISTLNDTDWHTYGVTRDEHGNFELFRDGVSQGTVNNTSITVSNYIMLHVDQSTYNSTFDFDDVIVK